MVIAVQLAAQKTHGFITAQLGFPQGEFKDASPVTGVGLRLGVLTKVSNEAPLSVGGELGFMVAGSDSKLFDLYYQGFYDRYRITASNNIISFAFKARADLLPAEQPVMLFVDGTIGTNLFFSSVDIEQETFFGNTQSAGGESTKGHWAFTWGPGLGIEIPLGKRKEIALRGKASYLFGSTTKYLTDPYIDNNGTVYFYEQESKTDMLVAELGIRINFYPRARKYSDRRR